MAKAVKLKPAEEAKLKSKQPVTTTVQPSGQATIGPFQINDAGWATLNSGGTVMVLAEIVGQNIMDETHVTT